MAADWPISCRGSSETRFARMPSHNLIVNPQKRGLLGSVPVPPDEQITPLAILCAAIAEGPTEVSGNAWGARTNAMIAALRCFQVPIEVQANCIRIEGRGLDGWREPAGPVDCGWSPATMRWLSGVLAAQPFASRLVGAAEAKDANMEQLAKTLRWRGGVIEGVFSADAPGAITQPLSVGPLPSGVYLSELEYDVGVMASDIKVAALLSGLYADGATYVREPFVTCDHAERRLQALDVPLATAGSVVALDPTDWSRRLANVSGAAVGDVGAGSMLLAAAALVPESRVSVRHVGLNPTRTSCFHFLRQMGGDVAIEVHAHTVGEPSGIAFTSSATLRAVTIEGEQALRSADELGVLAALAARAQGTSLIAAPPLSDAKARRFVSALRAFGLDADIGEAGLAVEGRPSGNLRAADVDAGDESDLATLGVLLGLVGDGPTRIRRVDGLARRFPRIVGTLRALGADLRVEEHAAGT
jgi:3-phosphoshikimate 1-carboxyvinyltransferase